MENPYRMNINAFMEEHWKSELEANGFSLCVIVRNLSAYKMVI